MEKKELEAYQSLSTFQKSLVDSLKELGFEHKYFESWELIGWGVVDVSKCRKLSDILKMVHQQGKDQKRFEIQRVLGL